MTVALVLLSFAGFLLAAGVRSDVSAAYVRWLDRSGGTGAVVAVHHVLLLPNQSFLIAAPAMGSCVLLDGTGSQPTSLCLRTLTVRPGFGGLLWSGTTTLTLGAAWLLFLVIPAIATVWGGLGIGAAAGSLPEAAIRGAGAGLVFAAAVVVGEALSAALITREPGGALISLGADLARTGVLACAWGVAGGVAGAVVAGRRQAGPEVAEPPLEPPSPTSV